MSEISKQALAVENTTNFPNNNTGYITPALLRSFNTDMIDSTVNQIVYTADSASWNSKISQLNAFTASQQPSFTAINAFTASQLNINSGYNTFTQSAGAELDSLSAWTGSWNAWTSSINEIRDDGVLQGYSTRFFFNGLVSASVVQNVNGPIANVTVEQDGTKLNTSSFNDYTASQNAWNASATASISQLLGFSSSLDATFATDAQLTITASALQANIDTKLNISSFNSYTQSITEAGYATTGSNLFIGNQRITGSLSTTGNGLFGDYTVNQYPALQTKVSTAVNPGNIYSTIGINNNGDAVGSAGIYASTFTSFGSGLVTGIYGGGTGNKLAGDGGNTAIYLHDSVMEIVKDTKVSGSLEVSSSLKVNGSNVVVSAQTSSFATTGSNIFVGNQTITGSLTTNGGAEFGNRSAQYNSLILKTSLTNFPGNLYNTLGIDVDNSSPYNAGLYISTYTGFGSNPVAALYGGGNGNNVDGGNTSMVFANGDIFIQKDTSITGSLTITGSVYQNVNAVSIASSTASIDLSVANYFTLTLSGATRINVLNPQPGVTATLVINTGASVTASFSSNVKQVSGSSYVPSPSGSTDIISLTSVDTSFVYLVPAYSFV